MSSRPSDRIRVRRNPKKGRYERERIESILDRGLVAHVAFINRGQPVCIPMLYARAPTDDGNHRRCVGETRNQAKSSLLRLSTWTGTSSSSRSASVTSSHSKKAPFLSFRERSRPGRNFGSTMRFRFAEIFVFRPEAAFFRSRVMHR